MEQEIWKTIKDYENYEVSNFGRIKSLYDNHNTRRDKILKYSVSQDKYQFYRLSKNKLAKNIFAHRLVAVAFIENINNKPQINHIDGNKQNNNVKNLEWCSVSDNLKHSYRTLGKKPNKTMLGKFGKDCCNSKPVLQYDLQGNFVKEWECISQVERELHINRGQIRFVCRKQRNSAGGFKWEYKNIN